jgi:DnaK suppressor protein
MSEHTSDRTRNNGIASASTVPIKSAYWTAQRLTKAKGKLSERVASLRADIARELRKYDDERLGLIASNVADSAEQSIADVIGDLYLAEIDRDVGELLAVESALGRLAVGTYGSCIACGLAIDPMRLEFNPQVARCLHCQEGAERPLHRAWHSAKL